MQRVVLVDGTALIYRAFFAIPGNLQTSSGLHTNAIYGFATMFRKLFAGKKPDFGAVVFDAPGRTFRDEKFPAYKAEREPMSDTLSEQLPYIDDLVTAHRFPILKKRGYEADDVIGTLTERAVAAGMEVLIVSGDKDFAQLIGDRVRMLDAMRDITYDAELVRKKWGVPPSQFVDLLALMGDKIDNIPGVPGIGAKGAAGLLEAYGSLQGIFQNLDALKPRQKSALQENRDQAFLSQELATIDRAVPLDVSLEDLAFTLPEPAVLDALYRSLEFNSLLSGAELRDVEGGDDADRHHVVDSEEGVQALVKKLQKEPFAAVVPIYEVPSPVTGALVGLALAPPSGSASYVPSDAPGAHLLLAYLASDHPKVAHDVKELYTVLARRGAKLGGAVGDTMLASFLVEPSKLVPHRLEQLTREYLQRAVRPAKRVLGSGQKQKLFGELEVTEVAAYAGQLAEAIAELWPILEAKLHSERQMEQYELRELPLTYVLGDMELTGILVDPQDLEVQGRELAISLAEVEARIYALAGREFNVASTKQLSDVLFDELKLPVVKRTKTGYSTNSEVLERLAPKHDIARELLEHRRISKLISTYTNVLQAAVQPDTGRIHARFQQTVGVTGRIISTDPDLQRTPIKTPDGKRIRRAFIAPEGKRLVSADWSQIELRILAHVSEDPLLLDSFRTNADVHARTAAQLFGGAPEDITPEQRAVGKTVNFATIYGQGATALGQILGIPRKEAETYIAGYFKAYAGVRAWLDRTIAAAMKVGYVTTLFGRRRYIPELSSNAFMEQQTGQRMAANTPIQGSAADLCKLAMLQIARDLEHEGRKARMVLQIHDELVLEVPQAEVEAVSALVRRNMENVAPLRVPLVVDLGVGRTWAEAH